MSENKVVDGQGADDAVLLLAAAEELGLPAEVVRTTGDSFVVPAEVYDKAYGKRGQPSESKTESKTPSKAAPKKAAPQKSTARKAVPQKSTSK